MLAAVAGCCRELRRPLDHQGARAGDPDILLDDEHRKEGHGETRLEGRGDATLMRPRKEVQETGQAAAAIVPVSSS